KATQVKVLSGMHGIALIAMRIANGILTKTGHSKAFGNLDEKYLEANGFTVLGAVYLGLNDRPAQGRGFGDNIRPRGRGSPAFVGDCVRDNIVRQCRSFINKGINTDN